MHFPRAMLKPSYSHISGFATAKLQFSYGKASTSALLNCDRNTPRIGNRDDLHLLTSHKRLSWDHVVSNAGEQINRWQRFLDRACKLEGRLTP